MVSDLCRIQTVPRPPVNLCRLQKPCFIIISQSIRTDTCVNFENSPIRNILYHHLYMIIPDVFILQGFWGTSSNGLPEIVCCNGLSRSDLSRGVPVNTTSPPSVPRRQVPLYYCYRSVAHQKFGAQQPTPPACIFLVPACRICQDHKSTNALPIRKDMGTS